MLALPCGPGQNQKPGGPHGFLPSNYFGYPFLTNRHVSIITCHIVLRPKSWQRLLHPLRHVGRWVLLGRDPCRMAKRTDQVGFSGSQFMEVLKNYWTIFLAIFCGDIPWNLALKHRPYNMVGSSSKSVVDGHWFDEYDMIWYVTWYDIMIWYDTLW